MHVPHPSPARLLAAVVVAGVAAVLAPAVPATAAQAPLSVTDQAVADKLSVRSLRRDLGPDLAGLVVDPATGQTVWQHTAGEAQIPASNAKILTAVDALEAFGPTYRFTTRNRSLMAAWLVVML